MECIRNCPQTFLIIRVSLELNRKIKQSFVSFEPSNVVPTYKYLIAITYLNWFVKVLMENNVYQ